MSVTISTLGFGILCFVLVESLDLGVRSVDEVASFLVDACGAWAMGFKADGGWNRFRSGGGPWTHVFSFWINSPRKEKAGGFLGRGCA